MMHITNKYDYKEKDVKLYKTNEMKEREREKERGRKGECARERESVSVRVLKMDINTAVYVQRGMWE